MATSYSPWVVALALDCFPEECGSERSDRWTVGGVSWGVRSPRGQKEAASDDPATDHHRDSSAGLLASFPLSDSCRDTRGFDPLLVDLGNYNPFRCVPATWDPGGLRGPMAWRSPSSEEAWETGSLALKTRGRALVRRGKGTGSGDLGVFVLLQDTRCTGCTSPVGPGAPRAGGPADRCSCTFPLRGASQEGRNPRLLDACSSVRKENQNSH